MAVKNKTTRKKKQTATAAQTQPKNTAAKTSSAVLKTKPGQSTAPKVNDLVLRTNQGQSTTPKVNDLVYRTDGSGNKLTGTGTKNLNKVVTPAQKKTGNTSGLIAGAPDISFTDDKSVWGGAPNAYDPNLTYPTDGLTVPAGADTGSAAKGTKGTTKAGAPDITFTPEPAAAPAEKTPAAAPAATPAATKKKDTGTSADPAASAKKGTAGTGTGVDRIAEADKLALPDAYTSPYGGQMSAQLEKLLAGDNPYLKEYGDIQDIAYDPKHEGWLEDSIAQLQSENPWEAYLAETMGKKPGEFVDTHQGDYEAALQKLLNPAARPEFEDKYGGNIADTVKAIENYGDFKYDINEDELYKNYADQYTRQAKLAAENAMGMGLAASGGYGNSYAQSAAQQGYNQTMQGLTDIMPQLEERAYGRWKDAKNDLRSNLDMYMGLDKDEWNKFRDRTSDWEFDVKNAYDQFNAIGDASKRDYDRWKDTYSNWQWDMTYGGQRLDAENNRRIGEVNAAQNAVNSDRDYNIDQNQLQATKRSQSLQAAGIYDDELRNGFNALLDADKNARDTQAQNFDQTIRAKDQLYGQGNTEVQNEQGQQRIDQDQQRIAQDQQKIDQSQQEIDNRQKQQELDNSITLAEKFGDFSGLEELTGLDLSDAKTRQRLDDALAIYRETGDTSRLKELGIDTSYIESERAKSKADWAAEYGDYSYVADLDVDVAAAQTIQKLGIDEQTLNNIAKQSNIDATEAATAIDLAANGDIEGAMAHGLSEDAANYIKHQSDLKTAGEIAQYGDYSYLAELGVDVSVAKKAQELGIEADELANILTQSNIDAKNVSTAIDLAASGDVGRAVSLGLSEEAANFIYDQSKTAADAQILSNKAAELGIQTASFSAIVTLMEAGAYELAQRFASEQGVTLTGADIQWIKDYNAAKLATQQNAANGSSGGSGGYSGGSGGYSGGSGGSSGGYDYPIDDTKPIDDTPKPYDAAKVSAAITTIDAWIDNTSGTIYISDIEASCKSMGLSAAEIEDVVSRYPDKIIGGKKQDYNIPVTGTAAEKR